MFTYTHVKEVHIIWLKGKLPKYMEKCIIQLIQVHPTIQINIWVDAPGYSNNEEFWQKCRDNSFGTLVTFPDLKQFNSHPIIETTKNFNSLSPATQSDLYRLAILQKYAGLYLDTDYYVVKNLFELLSKLSDVKYLSDQEKGSIDELVIIPIENRKGYHCNGFLYCAKPNNPFIEMCINTVLDMPQSLRKSLRVVGPDLIGTMQYEYRKAGNKGLISIPWAQLHSLEWRKAAKLFENNTKFVFKIPGRFETIASDSNTRYEVYAVHLWNDLIDSDVDITFEYCPNRVFSEYKLNIHEAILHAQVEIPKYEFPKNMIIKSCTMKECINNCIPLPELRVGDKYMEIESLEGEIINVSIRDIFEPEPEVSEKLILEKIESIVKERVKPALDCYSLTYSIVQKYTPIVIALCEYISKVADMYNTKNIVLCYRDSHLIYKVMDRCTRYSKYNLLPIWMNREIAGSVAGFNGPGYQFEPTYDAYGMVSPYSKWDISDELTQEVIEAQDAYKELYNKIDTKAIIFDLSTCFYSAQETLKHLMPDINWYGCYLFTFTRSTCDSYRLRDDYKAWGHITVNDENSKAMKNLESMLSYQYKAQYPGFVDSIGSFKEPNWQSYIISSAIDFINSVRDREIPTIATGLKVLPYRFEV